MLKSVIILDTVPPSLIEQFQACSWEVIYEPLLSYDNLSHIISKAQGIILSTRLKIDEPMVAKAHQLKWVGRLGSGLDHIDEDALKKRNIALISTPEGNAQAVGEHALGLILGLLRNIPKSYQEIQHNIWDRKNNRGQEISGKKIGIIGFGNTGSTLANLLQSFDVEILAHDKYKTGFSYSKIKEVCLEDIKTSCHIISLHLPLTPETHHYVNYDFFKQCQKKPYFISTCRGKITNFTDVLRALKEDLVSGIALDVLENENLESYTNAEKQNLDLFLQYSNTIVTPHIGGITTESFYKNSKILFDKLKFCNFVP